MTVSNSTPSVLILDSDFWSPLSLSGFKNNELHGQSVAPALMAAVRDTIRGILVGLYYCATQSI